MEMDEINPIEDALVQEAEDERRQEEIAAKEAQRLALIEKWHKRVSASRKHDKEYRTRWADDRKMARGDTDYLVDTNLVGAIMEVLLAFLYARDPDISVRPSQSVNRKMISEYRNVATTLQIMVSRLLKEAGLKRRAKKWVLGSMTVGVGWIKATMQTRQEDDPLVLTEISDLTQNREHIEALRAKNEGGEQSGEDYDSDMATIDANIKALESKRELTVAEGLVLDTYAPEDVIVARECGEVENYLSAPFVAFDAYKTIDEAFEITGWTEEEDKELLLSANRYMQRPRDGEEDEGGTKGSGGTEWTKFDSDAESDDGFLRFTEIWSKTDGVVYTLIDGINTKWARNAYAPITGKRFYPAFYLPCHEIDGERYPQSDVYQLKRLQKEYASTRSKLALHRERAIPGILFNKGAVDEKSLEAVMNSKEQEYVGIEMTNPSDDIRMAFTPKVYNAVDKALYDTSMITAEMEKVSGAQDALQSSVQVEKTATEAKIQEAGFGARSGARRDCLEDVLSELSEYATQLVLQTMDNADAIKYAGPDAAWVDLSTEEALMNFSVEVKAGSTGKPKANSDREIWTQLLPLIEKLIDRIGQARVQGFEWAAKPWIALLAETMLRLDDPAEIEKFLPVPPEPEPEPEPEPTDLELAEIEGKKSKALKDRSDVITNVSEMFTEQEAQSFLLFGGQLPAPQQQPQQQGGPGSIPEAPDPIEQ